jgi:prepilin-type processing-associated H-X9-DG protein
VQAAREAARRSQCSNNLRQMSIALHNYHDVFQSFPINYRPVRGGSYSWMQAILPFIEQANLYNQITIGGTVALSNNTAVANTPVKTYLCPSDGLTRGGVMANRADGGGTKAVNNYKASSGAYWVWQVVNTDNVRWPHGVQPNTPGNSLVYCDGLMCSNSYGSDPSDVVPGLGVVIKNLTRFSTITDGTSNTFAIGEAIPAWSQWCWWYNQNAAVATCGIPLNYRKGIDKLDQFANQWQRNYSFYSLHPSGANFAMCDASVRFVPDNIDLNVYRAISTTEGGESVAAAP